MKYEVLAEAITLVVKKGSIVILDEEQGRLASRFLKEIKQEKKEKEKK